MQPSASSPCCSPNTCRRLAEKEGLFGGALGLLSRHFVMTTADMAACDQDDTPDLRAVAAVLERVLEIRKTSLQQRRLVRLCLWTACAPGLSAGLCGDAAPWSAA